MFISKPRPISPIVKSIVRYSSGFAILGYIFLAVGIFASCLIAQAILEGDPKAWNGAPVFIFPLAGLGMILFDGKRIRRKFHLLAYGKVADGTFSHQKTHVSRNSNGGHSETHEYFYKFRTEDEEGRTASIVTWTVKAHPEKATIIYDPSGAIEACILELEPGGMHLDNSTVKGAPALAALVYLLPASVVMAGIFGALLLT